MRITAALQTSLDGFIEGPQGELDWAMADDDEAWRDVFVLLDSIDACILGRVMYPDYERFWMAVLANPDGPMPQTGRPATENEIVYARRAENIPHYVLSKTLEKAAWKPTRIIRDVDEIRRMKEAPGKEIYVVGGATLVSSLMNRHLIDELRVTVNPILLGGGKALFKDVTGRRALKLLGTKSFRSGKVALTYSVHP